jgi:hypothetical protein
MELPTEPTIEDYGIASALEFAQQASDNPTWLYRVCEDEPERILELMEWLPTLGGLFPPPGQTWVDWIEAVQVCADLPWATGLSEWDRYIPPVVEAAPLPVKPQAENRLW